MAPRLFTIFAAILLAVTTARHAPAEGTQQSSTANSRANLVLITIDTLRADYVSSYGSSSVKTPALDELAADGALFENAYCQVPMTPPSHASILTGLYPATHGLRDFTGGKIRDGTETLATMLKESGYQTAAFISAFVLDRSWGLSEGFDLYWDNFDIRDYEGVNPGNIQRPASETIDRVLEWLEKARGPFFVWVHLFDPHHDYNPPEPFKARYRSNPYAGEVAYTDSQIQRLLDRLKLKNLYRDALIVAVSDHGESLGEHGEQEHGFFVYEATARIPLIVKLPSFFGIRGKRVPETTQTVDIVPTLLQVLRVPQKAEWKLEGQGLLSVVLGKRSQQRFAYTETIYPQVTFGWSPLKAYREGSLKLIDAPKPELYDLSQDPGEEHNLFSSRKDLAAQLKDKLRQFEANFVTPADLGARETDDERSERLAALGYVAVARPVFSGPQEDLPDPKDMVGVYNQVLAGLQASEAGQPERSVQLLGEVARKEPGLFIVHYSIGLDYLKLRRPQEALEAFQRAAALNPDYRSIDLQKTRALNQLGRTAEAVDTLEALLRKEPSHLAARRELGRLYLQVGRLDEAVGIFKQIVVERPEDRPAAEMLGVALVRGQRYAEGLEVLEKAQEAGGSSALLFNFLGIAQSNLGRKTQAVESYRAALRSKPDYWEAMLNLAFLLLETGQREEALAQYDALCRGNPVLCRRYSARFGR